MSVCKAVTSSTYYQCVLYLLATHGEEPKDVNTSLGMLLIRY
jgi:hypothetical protein